MKNSVAIWADESPENSDLHINYWIIKRSHIFRDHFIDVGVKLLEWGGGKVYFFVPIQNLNMKILEIGSELRERDLANALFNENCKITLADGKRFEIKLPKESLTVFVFDKNNDVQITQRYNGTIFSFNIPREKKNWYIRFRLQFDIKNAIFSKKTIRSSFSNKQTPSGSFYQSVRSSVDAVNFRVNSKRSLDLSLLDDNQDRFLRLDKLHFFLIYDSDEEFAFSTTAPKNVRLLENYVWKKYLNNISIDNRKYCATHWSCSPLMDEGWEIFFKVRFESANILTITTYLLLICLMAFAINLLSAITFEELKAKFSNNSHKTIIVKPKK